MARSRLVAFGGVTPRTNDETWEWDGAAWTQVVVAASPPGRVGHGMVYEAAWQRVLVFGGDYFHGDTWLYGSQPRAEAAPFGTGCGAGPSLPALAATPPALGASAMLLDLVDGPPAAPCLLAVATASRATPVGTCTVHLDGVISSTFHVSNGSGFASRRIVIPPLVPLRGLQVFAQGFALDATAPPPGLATTNALRLTVGD